MLGWPLLALALHPASNPPQSCRRVFVSNLPFACGEAELSTALAERFGPVSSLRLAPSQDADSSGHRGFGTLEFVDAAVAAEAVATGRATVAGRSLAIIPLREQQQQPARPRPSRQPTGRGRPPMPPRRGALLHRVSASSEAPAFERARAALGPLQSVKEYSIVMTAAGAVGDAVAVEALLAEMDAAGVARDAWLYTAAISALSAAGRPEQALKTFDEMRDGACAPNVFSFSAAISACEKGRVATTSSW